MYHILNQFSIAIKIAFRNFLKNRLYGSINILGLSIAFATLIFVLAYLNQETTYEAFYENADRIYRPTYHISSQNDYEVHFARIPGNFINELPEYMPEIERQIRFQNKEQKYIRIGENRFRPEHAYVTDHDVFKVFDIQFIEGDPNSALIKPNSVVLTESIALKYFSKTNILGEELIVTGDWSAEEKIYQVTGVIQDLPVNTHLPIEILFSFANEERRTGWAYVYTLLSKGASISDVEAKIPDFIKKYSDSDNATALSIEFQALSDIHLQSHLAREIVPNGQQFYIRIFFWVGLFIWIIAIINFTNLSTALAMSKGKEVGVRRVLGSPKSNLVLFLLTESVVYSIVSLFFGSLLVLLFFPAFRNHTGISILPSMEYFIPLLMGIALLSGLLAGILPSLAVTSVKVLQIMKQGNNWSMKKNPGKINVKRVIITLQFCATIILISGAMVAHRQFKFINDKNLGLKPDQILSITEVPDMVTKQYVIFKNLLKEIPGVREVSACMQVPSSEIRDSGPVLVRGLNEDVNKAPMMDIQIIDPDFVEMMGLEFLAGEDFSSKVTLNQLPEFNEDLKLNDYLAGSSREYLINETAMKQLGWKEPSEAIGQAINWSIGSFDLAYGPIVGVIKDYNQESLRNKIDPIVMMVEPLWLKNILIKVETKNLEKTIAGIESIWNDLFPYALEYEFLDELFNKLYYKDRIQLELLSTLALIAILISFMGLVSMVAFALKRRSKELAIRRVFGAEVGSLTRLIAKEYFWVLAIAAFVGIPISHLWVTEWLQNFAYHINVLPFVYLLSVILLFALVLIIIFLQTFKATKDNPVEALREE
ncbi:MAG: hypothetical protein DRI73_06980 [Bacteroidetes bacterium]|nr:MAG: hypothetical protein DRI73_06980 [Bacteroidota bacterium]